MPRKWILAVDDEPAMLKLLEDMLAGPNHVVTTATDAKQAFLQARDLKPALIVCDVMMPGYGTGVDALKELRKDPGAAGIPFIFVTGMPAEQAKALIPQGDPKVRLFQKPVDWKAVHAAVKELSGLDVDPAGGGA
jgi:CheY-like chemotaxis protein